MVFDGDQPRSVKPERRSIAPSQGGVMAFDGDQPLTVPTDRPAQSVPDRLSGLASEETPATVAVPRGRPNPGPGVSGPILFVEGVRGGLRPRATGRWDSQARPMNAWLLRDRDLVLAAVQAAGLPVTDLDQLPPEEQHLGNWFELERRTELVAVLPEEAR